MDLFKTSYVSQPNKIMIEITVEKTQKASTKLVKGRLRSPYLAYLTIREPSNRVPKTEMGLQYNPQITVHQVLFGGLLHNPQSTVEPLKLLCRRFTVETPKALYNP